MILVSISCITYNHENYIGACLDGFLMQKCNFQYEILIHDDASTDKTQEIIKEYQSKYPDIIKPIFQTENQWSKGVRGINFKFNLPRAEGKYFAMCEGDDYWTDPLKLQKQFDLVEAYPEYVMCTHDYLIHYEHKNISDQAASELYKYLKNKPLPVANCYKFTIRDFAKNLDGLHTATNFLRTDVLKSVLDTTSTYVTSGDYQLKLLMLQKGDGIFINELMSVLRKNPSGVTQQKKDPLKHFNIQKEQLTYFAGIAPASCKKYFYRRLWKIYPNYILGKKGYGKLISLKDRLAAVIPFFNSLVKSF